jgi:hypothetical protein
LLLHEIGDDLHDQLRRQAIQVQLYRMGQLQTLAVIVELDLICLVFLIDLLR